MTTVLIETPRPRARRGLFGAFLVVEAMSIRSRRNWRGTFIVGTIVPVCFLAALGFGLGSLVPPGAFGAHVSYLAFLAPALLASSTVQYGISEAAEPVMAGFKWQRTYEAAVATPVTAGQLMLGHLCWIVVRLLLVSVLFFVAMAAFGVVTSPSTLLAVPFAVLGSLSAAAPVMAYAATVRDGSAFTLMNRLVVVPMVMFSGTFFPIAQLPSAVQAVVWLTPLSHTVALCRGVALGGLTGLDLALHLGVLLAWLLLGAALARSRFVTRLAS